MRRAVLALVVVAVAIGAFLYVQPILVLRSFTAAMDESDAETIRDHVDFESARQALKDDILAHADAESREAEGTVVGVLGMALIGGGVETMVDGLLTPEGLARTGGRPAEITSSGYETTSRFHATIDRGAGDITLVLRRQGTAWRVTAIKPPESAWRGFESHRRELTAEVRTNLETIITKLAERHERLKTSADPKVIPTLIRIPWTPAEPPCGKPYTWTEEDIAAWKVIGFSPSGPVNYSYSVAKHHDVGIHRGMVMMVAQAVGDLDCNGKTSYFSHTMGEDPRDGTPFRAPGIYAKDETE